MRTRLVLAAAASLVASSIFAGIASAHAELSPPVVVAKRLQVITLAVPTEKEGTTTQIVLTVPSGFGIDSFVPSPGWKRTLQQTGSGEDAVIQKVTYSGGSVPTGEDSTFSFLAAAGLEQDVHVRRAADLLRRVGRRLGRARVVRHSRADDRGEVDARRR